MSSPLSRRQQLGRVMRGRRPVEPLNRRNAHQARSQPLAMSASAASDPSYPPALSKPVFAGAAFLSRCGADRTGAEENRSEHDPYGFASPTCPGGCPRSLPRRLLRRRQIGAGSHDDSRCPHFVDGFDAVPRLDLYASDGVLDYDDVQSRAPRVQRRRFDAIVGGQAADKGAANAAPGEEGGQVGPLKAGIRLGSLW